MNKSFGQKLVAGLSGLVDKTAVVAGKSLYNLESTAAKVAEAKNEFIGNLPKIKVTVER